MVWKIFVQGFHQPVYLNQINYAYINSLIKLTEQLRFKLWNGILTENQHIIDLYAMLTVPTWIFFGLYNESPVTSLNVSA